MGITSSSLTSVKPEIAVVRADLPAWAVSPRRFALRSARRCVEPSLVRFLFFVGIRRFAWEGLRSSMPTPKNANRFETVQIEVDDVHVYVCVDGHHLITAGLACFFGLLQMS